MRLTVNSVRCPYGAVRGYRNAYRYTSAIGDGNLGLSELPRVPNTPTTKLLCPTRISGQTMCNQSYMRLQTFKKGLESRREMDRQIVKLTERLEDRQTDLKTERQTEKEKDRQTDRQTESRQMDRQRQMADREADQQRKREARRPTER